MSKTAPILVEMYGLAPQGRSQKLMRGWLSATGPEKKNIVGWAWGMEQSGALPQIGDQVQWSERVTHEEIALMMGCTRETVTKSLGRLYHFSDPCKRCDGPGHTLKCLCKCHTTHPEWREDSLCTCHGMPRRECQSEKISAIAANHPHWKSSSQHRGTEERRKYGTEPIHDASDAGDLRPQQPESSARGGNYSLQNLESGRSGSSTHPFQRSRQKYTEPEQEEIEASGTGSLPENEGKAASNGMENPGPGSADRSGAVCRRPKDGRKHIAPILTRNPGWACANAYALNADAATRPGIGAGSNQVGWLAHTFGAEKFSRQAQGEWLEPYQSLEGYRKSRPQWFDPLLPDAWDCECVLGQKKFNFQEVCPTCNGRGFIKGTPTPENNWKGSMPWIGRMILHFLDDRGWDIEWRRCKKCNTQFEGNEFCKCGSRGDVVKKRGELNTPGSRTQYTMEDIAAALGLDLSTVYRYFTKFKRLGILRTAKGDVWRKCQRCPNLPLYSDKCPGCGSMGDPIKRSDAQLIIDLTSRTLDKQMAAMERARLEALVKWHRRWLDERHQAELVAAVEMAKKVLSEWEGREHLLLSFWKEMRRRLEASKSRANLVNILFPLQPG